VDQAFDLGAVAVGATIYYGSPESRRQIEEISAAFAQAHELGLFAGRKAFQRPMKEGIALLNAVQDVYLDKDITVA
jgi:DhnA family fructose-bisphosphate aldolase class Ia